MLQARLNMYTRLSQIPQEKQEEYFLVNSDVFEKDNKLFRLPIWNKDKTDINEKEDYPSIKQFISDSTEKLHTLVSKENTEVISYVAYSHKNSSVIKHGNNKFENYAHSQLFSKESNTVTFEKVNERIRNLRWMEKAFVHFNYSIEDNNKIFISKNFRNMVSLLTPEKEHPKKTTISFEHFSDLIDSIVLSIDDLFLQQSIRPTAQNRDNLISLAYSLDKRLTKGKKFNALLGTTAETYNLTHPALVKAADEGYNDGIFKMLYVHSYNPKKMEDIEIFKDIPFEMFEALIGKN